MASSLSDKISTFLSYDLSASSLRTSAYREPIGLAREIVEDFDKTQADKQKLGLSSLPQLLFSLQRLAYIDPDSGYDTLLAEWTERKYACMIQNSKDDIEGHMGLGRSWLLKSQSSLAKIEAADNSDSSQSQQPGCTNTLRARNGAEDDSEIVESADYVQARDMLRAALEHLDRALVISHKQGSMSGSLLELAAETYMHLGNVTSSRENERLYQRALHLLQRASEIDSFDMDHHLEEYLDDNADYISELANPWYTRTG